MAWTTAPDGSQVWQEVTQEQATVNPPVPETDPDPSEWVTQTGGTSNMTELEYQATVTAQKYRDEAKEFRDTTLDYRNSVASEYADIQVRQADVVTRQTNVAERQADVTTRQADVVTRQNDIIARQNDVTTKQAKSTADAAATAADRVQTGTDRVATGADRADVAQNTALVAADRQTTIAARDTATGAATTAVGARDAALGYRDTAGGHAAAAAADRNQTGLDRAATGADVTTTLGYRDTALGARDAAIAARDAAAGYRDEAAALVATVDMTNYYQKTETDARYTRKLYNGGIGFDWVNGAPIMRVDVTDIPLSKDGHKHLWADITDKPATYAPSAHTHDWASITGKPATFAPSAHTHDDRYYTETEADTRFSPIAGPGTAKAFRAGDITAARADGSGVIFLNADNTRYLYWDAAAGYYQMPSAGLKIGSGKIDSGGWTLGSDGNLYMPWAGKWLSTYLNDVFATKQNNLGYTPVSNQYRGTGTQIGWDGSYFQMTQDTTYLGAMITHNNFMNMFGFRRTAYGESSLAGPGNYSNGTNAGPAATVVTGVKIFSSVNHVVYYFQLQWYWNGTWYAIQG